MSDHDRATMAFQLLEQVLVLLKATSQLGVYKTALEHAQDASDELFSEGVGIEPCQLCGSIDSEVKK